MDYWFWSTAVYVVVVIVLIVRDFFRCVTIKELAKERDLLRKEDERWIKVCDHLKEVIATKGKDIANLKEDRDNLLLKYGELTEEHAVAVKKLEARETLIREYPNVLHRSLISMALGHFSPVPDLPDEPTLAEKMKQAAKDAGLQIEGPEWTGSRTQDW